MEASKALSKLLKSGPRAQLLFEKMHARGATQRLQPVLSGTCTIFGPGFTEIMQAIYIRRDRHLPDVGGCKSEEH